jgi:hypothetical protein
LRSFSFLLLCVALAGCLPAVAPAGTPTASPAPASATSTAVVALQASSTPPPYTIATPPLVLAVPPPSPTPEALPLPFGVPLEAVALFEPGPGSQVTSPLHITGFAGPSRDERLHLRLIGEEGQVLAEHTTFLLSSPGIAGRFAWDLPFHIDGVAERGRLIATIDSLRDGRLSHLASVPLVLLSFGEPLLRSTTHGPEKLTIVSPRKNSVLHGGVVTVVGGGWTDSDLPLTIEVLDRSGAAIGSLQLPLDVPPGTSAVFQAEVHFQVDRLQVGRVSVSEFSPDLPGLVHVATIDVVLQP